MPSSVSIWFTHAGRSFVSLFAPKTPRGKMRRAIFLVAMLFFLAGNLAYPKPWNSAANWINAQLKKNAALSRLQIPQFWNVPFRLGLDLQGGVHLVYKADVRNIPENERADAISGARDVIERRVNAFGVAEPLVQTNKSGDEWRVIADLAGITDVAQAIKLIGETPILEFKEQGSEPRRALTAEETKQMNDYNVKANALAKDVLKKAKAPNADFVALAKQYSDDTNTKANGGDTGFVTAQDINYSVLLQPIISSKLKVGQVFPNILTIQNSQHIVKLTDQKQEGTEVRASHILICWQGLTSCQQTRTKTEARTLIDSIKKQALTANFGELAKKNSDDTGSATQGGDLDFFSKGNMIKEFEDVAFSMQKGQISEVVESPFGFHVIYKTDERPLTQYRLNDIAIKTKTADDFLPPQSQWKNTELSGKDLKRAALQFDQRTGEAQVSLQFNDNGKKLFDQITARNIGQPVAIFLDGRPLSTPTVQQRISEGEAVITGRFAVQEAKLLAQRLNAGALPVPITLESQQSVGASLGQDSLDSSLKAGLIGFLVVALFMLLYYRLPGIIAILALVLYAALNAVLYKLIPVTLSLSGIAGFILSVGMAVDANILIFERMKEELQRGRPLASALEEGFKRAWTSIRDSNFTTLISCVILFYTSSSLVKGFALTLGLGVLTSMISAITVSRTLLRLVSGWNWLKNPMLYLPGLSKLPKQQE